MVIGDLVKGGIYGEQPSLKFLLEGDLRFNLDFRGTYGTIAEKRLGLDAAPIIGGNFDKPDFVEGWLSGIGPSVIAHCELL